MINGYAFLFDLCVASQEKGKERLIELQTDTERGGTTFWEEELLPLLLMMMRSSGRKNIRRKGKIAVMSRVTMTGMIM